MLMITQEMLSLDDSEDQPYVDLAESADSINYRGEWVECLRSMHTGIENKKRLSAEKMKTSEQELQQDDEVCPCERCEKHGEWDACRHERFLELGLS